MAVQAESVTLHFEQEKVVQRTLITENVVNVAYSTEQLQYFPVLQLQKYQFKEN